MPTSLRSAVFGLCLRASPLVALVLAFSPVFLAQAPAAPALTIGLGEGAAPPGSQAVVPLTLTAPDTVAVGAITLRVTLPATQLVFTKIDPSGLSVGVGAKVTAEAQAATDGTSVLRVSVTTGGEGGSGQAIPPGPVAYLTFTVGQNASSGSTLTLPTEVTATSPGPSPRPLTPVAAASGTVTVTEPPVPACFFYMH